MSLGKTLSGLWSLGRLRRPRMPDNCSRYRMQNVAFQPRVATRPASRNSVIDQMRAFGALYTRCISYLSALEFSYMQLCLC